MAVRNGTYPVDPEHTQNLENLKGRIAAGATSDSFAGKRIENISGLTQYYRDIGAYADITPGDSPTSYFHPGAAAARKSKVTFAYSHSLKQRPPAAFRAI